VNRQFIAAALMLIAASAFAQEEQKAAEPWTLWKSKALVTPYSENLSDDEKVAGLARFWSEVKFNFANFALVPNLDWDAEFMAYLPRVRATKSTAEYYRVLQELCAKLHDGHTYVWPPKAAQPQFFADVPLTTRLVEGRVIVTSGEGVTVGDELLSIDRIPAKDYGAQRVAPYVFASTPQDRDLRTYTNFLLTGPVDTTVHLTFKDANEHVYTKDITRTFPTPGPSPAPKPLAIFEVLDGNIGHLSLMSFSDERIRGEYDALWEQVAKTSALIIDVRANGGGNGSNGFYVLSTLTDKPFQTSRWRTRKYLPAERAWNRPEQWEEHEAGTREPDGKRLYTKPVFLLIGTRTFSAAEDFASAFVAMKRGHVIGQPSGGSTGQPLIITLPGGGTLGICTKHDSMPDGTEFVGVGVQPDIAIVPTIADVRAKRDATLLRAVDEAKRAIQLK